MKKALLLLVSVGVLFTGCATKSMVIDGKKYTQGPFDSEWKLEGEVTPVDENTIKIEEPVGYAAGQTVGTAAVAGVFVLTLPLRVVETTIKSVGTNKNNSNSDVNTSTISTKESKE